MLPALRHVLGTVDHHCHSLRADWGRLFGGEPPAVDGPGWRQCFTEADDHTVLARDVPHLLGYRHFLRTIDGLLHDGDRDRPPAPPVDEPVDLLGDERRIARTRDDAARAEGSYLRRLHEDAGIRTLLVDTGLHENGGSGAGGPAYLDLSELGRLSGSDVREVVRLESVAEEVLARHPRSLTDLADEVRDRLADRLDRGAVGFKSVLAYRCGLAQLRPPESVGHGEHARRRAFAQLDQVAQARRFDDPVLAPFLVWQAAEFAAERGVPLQFHTGFGDRDIDLATADPALLRPLFHDPRTEACAVVLLHCHPYTRGAAYLAGTYPRVYLDLSLTIPLAEPIAATLVTEALALCPASKLLAASDGHSYPEMHWWGSVVWDRALRRVLDREIEGGMTDESGALRIAARILGDNARDLYGLHGDGPAADDYRIS